MEELGNHHPHSELHNYYRRAESLLAQSQYPEIKLSLGECARRLLAARDVSNPEAEIAVSEHINGNGSFPEADGKSANTMLGQASLEELVLHYEGDLIKQALEISGGSVTRAARLLGVTHQGLAFILNGRQKALLSVRTPVKTRRRSIIRYR